MNEQYSEYAVTVRQTIGMRLGNFFLFRGGSLEYETIFLDGTLEISAIYNKTRRKKKFQCEMKDVLGYKLGQKEEAVRLGKITRDFSSHSAGETCCVMKVNHEKGTEVICFEPGKELEEILDKRYRMLKA